MDLKVLGFVTKYNNLIFTFKQMIPKSIIEECLYPNQKYIKLVDEEIGLSCSCEIEEDDEACSEKYIASEWQDYVELRDLVAGNILEIMVCNNAKQMKVKKIG